VTSAIYEYSYARFIEQYFYNDMLENMPKGQFNCSHKVHRDIQRIFIVNGIKIVFSFTTLDVYNVEILRLKSLDVSQVFQPVIYDEYNALRSNANNFMLDLRLRLDIYLDILK